jgi:hypothetical protein
VLPELQNTPLEEHEGESNGAISEDKFERKIEKTYYKERNGKRRTGKMKRSRCWIGRNGDVRTLMV